MMHNASLPIAMLGIFELIILGVAGCLLFGFFRRRDASFGGTLLKVLGIGAIVAGVAVMWVRVTSHHDDHAHVTVAVPHDLDIQLDELDFDFDYPRPEPLLQAVDSHVRVEPDRWMFISLGTVLIILGALLFSREKTRPGALKVVTWLGVGAIVYSLVTFFGDPPRHVGEDVRVVRLDHQAVPMVVQPGRAKRPSIRPHRVHAEKPAAVPLLPARSGDIPVEVELVDAAEPVKPEAPAKPEPPVASYNAATENTESSEAKPEEEKPDEVAPAEKVPEPKSAYSAEKSEVDSKPKEVAVEAKPVVATTDIAPAATVVSGARPAWVEAPPKLDSGIYAMSIRSGPYVSVPECQRALDAELVQSVNHYIDLYRGDGASSLVAIPLTYIRKNLLRGEHAEIVESQSVGAMHQLHAKLEFDDKARADFDRLWRNAVVENRLWYTVGGAALVLALLATFYGYLKLDMKTGGAHKGRLQLAATLVALIVAAGVLLARQAVHF